MLKAWYGNLDTAAKDIGIDRRPLGAMMKGLQKPSAAWLETALGKGPSAKRARLAWARRGVAKANDVLRSVEIGFIEADSLEANFRAMLAPPSPTGLVWTNNGYRAVDTAKPHWRSHALAQKEREYPGRQKVR